MLDELVWRRRSVVPASGTVPEPDPEACLTLLAMTSAPAGTWAAMAIRAYRVLFYSATIVIFGVIGQTVARGWLAREITGSNAGLGAVLLVYGVAMLLSTPFAGVAADRYPKRTVLMASVAVLMVSSFAVGLAAALGTIAYWMLLVASGVQAAAFAFYLPARLALTSEVVPPSLIQNGLVLTQTSQEAMRVFAPALAGLLIGVSWFGPGGVFLAAGSASALALFFLSRLPRTPPQPLTAVGSPFGQISEALAYMRVTPGLGLVAALNIGVVMVAFSYVTFLPTLADDRFRVGAAGYGLMSTAVGVGALLAGLFSARLNGGARPWQTIGVSSAAFGCSVLLLAVANSFLLALCALAGLGASGLVFQTSTQAQMMRISAPEYHGRLQSLVVLGFSGYGLAALPLGILADAISLRSTLLCVGAAVLAMTAGYSMLRRRHVPTRRGRAASPARR